MKKHSLFGGLVVLFSLMLAAPLHAATAIGTEAFLDRFFGVNLHLSNCCNGEYEDITRVNAELRYIGARRLRDWVTTQATLLERWQAVQNGTGLPFHASIPSTSPMGQRASLRIIKEWLAQHPKLIRSIEGPNEPDMAYAVNLGATLPDSVEVQHATYKIGRAAGVKVAQMSVGAGWYPPLYEGNYKKFGKPPADLGNAHVYMDPSHPPILQLDKIGKLAAWSVDDKPIMVTEFGVYHSSLQSDDDVSAFMHIAPFTSYIVGHDSLYVYALHDDSSNIVGFYDKKGDKRAFADYWHVTSRLLADPQGKKLPPKPLNISYATTRPDGKLYGVQHAPLYKSDGSIWVAVYQENKLGAEDQTDTVSFDRPYPVLALIDGRTGEVLEQQENASSQNLVLPANHLFFVVAAPNAKALPKP